METEIKNTENTVNEVAVATAETTAKTTTPTFTRKVISVTIYKDNERRVIVTFDGEPIPGYKDGTPTTTNNFGISTRVIATECASKVPMLMLANTLAMGDTINPQIVALCLTGATITFSRTFREKGSIRDSAEFTGRAEVYDNDTFKTSVVDVKPNIDGTFVPYIQQLIQTCLKAKKETTTTTPDANPFAGVVGL